MDIRSRFKKSIDSFYKKSYHLAGQISKLGYPELCGKNIVPTAGVSWDKKQKKVRFVFNKEFGEKLNDEEFAFVVAHEATHVINGHIFYLQDELGKLKKRKASKKEVMEFRQKFAIASDCIVNDTLVNLYGFPKITLERIFYTPEELSAQEKPKCPLFYGENVIGCSCHNFSITDVMQLLPPDVVGTADDLHILWSSFFNADGTINKDFIDNVKDFWTENESNSSLSPEDHEQLQKAMDYALRSNGRSPIGTANTNHMVSYERAFINWETLLNSVTESKKFEENWGKPPRKLTSFYPETILPSQVEKETKEVAFFIDVSGSIDWDAVNLFVSLIRNTPKHYKIRTFTFNTECEEIDIHSDEIKTGGGTSFHIIEEHIQKEFNKYPQCVVVLTDGCGDEVIPKNKNKWLWLLYGSSSVEYCKNMKYYFLKNMISRL